MTSVVHGLATALLVLALPDAAGPRQGPISIVQITVSSRAEMDALTADGYDISGVKGSVVTLYVTAEERRALEALGYTVVEVGTQPAPGLPGPKAGEGYHTYATLTSALQDDATQYPALCRVTSLGKSVQNRDLWAVHITADPDVKADKPEFKYVATMHGDEPLGTELCLKFIDRLLDDYGTDARITRLVDTTEIWLVPLMNPDGLTLGTRFNAEGYDLNRSFPAYPEDFTGTIFDGEPLDTAGRPVEVAHVMRWTAEHSFVLSANLHTGSLVVNYPYDDDGKPSGTNSPTPDDLLFRDVSMRYSKHNLPMWHSARFTDGITNGAAWYVVVGGMQDWNYRYAACNEVTIELSNTKALPAAAGFAQLCADNEESMLRYLEAVHIGVRGLVLARATRTPLCAEVRVEGNDHAVYTDPDVGDYHRMLLPGTYALTFSAPNCVSRTIPDITVGDREATRVDADLIDADVNSDGTVNAVDVQLVIDAILGRPVPYDGDVDGGGVTATDLQTVINVVLQRE